MNRVDMAGVLEWSGTGLIFEGGVGDSPRIRLDGDSAAATSPVQALLLSLAACTAADVVDILTKMRVPFGGLRLRFEGERATEAPRRFVAVRIIYEMSGLAAEDEPKLQRAVALSHEKYCSVLHTLKTDIEFSTEVVLN